MTTVSVPAAASSAASIHGVCPTNAGRRPVERNSLYEAVRDAFDDPPPAAESRRRALPVVHAA